MTSNHFQHSALETAHLRVARPTDRIQDLQDFFCNALGFKVLGNFTDHDGFDGIMLGHEGAGYHLEFTTKRGHDIAAFKAFVSDEAIQGNQQPGSAIAKLDKKRPEKMKFFVTY